MPKGSSEWALPCICDEDPDCKWCDGTEWLPMVRCPEFYARQAPAWMLELVRSYSQFDVRHVMPVAGGWMDQSAGWCRAVSLLDERRGRWAKIKEAVDKENEELEKMKRDAKKHSLKRR